MATSTIVVNGVTRQYTIVNPNLITNTLTNILLCFPGGGQTDLNFIQIPLRLCQYKTYRDELKRLSQAMVQCELENLFHEATIHHDEPYPFLLNHNQTFYVCKKQ